jgi:hypothetical protein
MGFRLAVHAGRGCPSAPQVETWGYQRMCLKARFGVGGEGNLGRSASSRPTGSGERRPAGTPAVPVCPEAEGGCRGRWFVVPGDRAEPDPFGAAGNISPLPVPPDADSRHFFRNRV